jgi:glutamate-1-semialdehyde 2,1-aminomutase
MHANAPLDSLPFARAQDTALRERARRVIPGGMFGHMNVASLPPNYPQFFEAAEGCRLRDADGRRFIDFMCAYGPMIVGYRNPTVDEAAARQASLGDLMTGPSGRMVELAERLVDLLPHADWALFQKNGTDATTLCVTIARAATGRRKVLVARNAYHGAAPWCTPYPSGVTAEDRTHLGYFDYNDLHSLQQAFESVRGDVAAVIVSAFKHDFGRDQQLPSVEFAQGVRRLCDAHHAALVLDDVRAGFRLDMRGSWEPLGVRPDLSAWSKAIANGYPLAFVSGNDAYREAAAQVYATGSFWCGSVAMAAALATLDVLAQHDAIAHMQRMGERLRAGLQTQARRHGVGIRQSGPAQMPQVLFDDDPSFERGMLFTQVALEHGVYLHPRHNMFLSLAHTPADIDEALQATDIALGVVATRFGAGVMQHDS